MLDALRDFVRAIARTVSRTDAPADEDERHTTAIVAQTSPILLVWLDGADGTTLGTAVDATALDGYSPTVDDLVFCCVQGPQVWLIDSFTASS